MSYVDLLVLFSFLIPFLILLSWTVKRLFRHSKEADQSQIQDMSNNDESSKESLMPEVGVQIPSKLFGMNAIEMATACWLLSIFFFTASQSSYGANLNVTPNGQISITNSGIARDQAGKSDFYGMLKESQNSTIAINGQYNSTSENTRFIDSNLSYHKSLNQNMEA